MSASRTLAAGHSSEMGLYEMPCNESLQAWGSGLLMRSSRSTEGGRTEGSRCRVV